jgi:hypothetical protein
MTNPNMAANVARPSTTIPIVSMFVVSYYQAPFLVPMTHTPPRSSVF